VKSTSAGLLTLSFLLAPAACQERQTPTAQKAPAKRLAQRLVPTAVVSAAVPARGLGAPDAMPQPNRAVGVGDHVPDFALTDQTGKTVRLSEMRGEPVALTFLYTQCPVSTACPMTTAKFSRLDAMLKEKNFGRLLVVTVDPQRDTPKALAEYAKKAGADPGRWKFLTGDAKSVAEVATHFGVMYYPQGAQIVHTQAVAVLDREGRLSKIYYGEDWQPEHLLRDLEKARKG
jgi:protein SCO1/2